MGTSSAHPAPLRHHDHGVHLARFTGRILVVCPRCGGRALVVPPPGLAPPRHLGELLFSPRRLVCPGCGTVADHRPERRAGAVVGARPGGTEDPFFRQPLWLQTRCAGRILWAYDEEHVDALAAYVGAHHRVRHASPTLSMFARLPAWTKSAGNRREVLAGLATLRSLAALSAPADRSDAAHPRGDRSRHTGSLGFFRR
ncbi:TFIIB-type zinc ribbon-containing protein [Streptomyces sp. NPDC085529]|uniref:TFIIB-type zinc ribbon-containing protein n=1 Tax=Streptomyces sp. NPDC085529 TaxID=3365729 RepID=UPI0037D300EF